MHRNHLWASGVRMALAYLGMVNWRITSISGALQIAFGEIGANHDITDEYYICFTYISLSCSTRLFSFLLSDILAVNILVFIRIDF